MNERIDKLFEQALEEFTAENKYATIIVPDPLKEKFAELIVRECCELTLDYKGDDYYSGWLDYRDEIKRHFGVTE